jgi:hypothetical protein
LNKTLDAFCGIHFLFVKIDFPNIQLNINAGIECHKIDKFFLLNEALIIITPLSYYIYDEYGSFIVF